MRVLQNPYRTPLEIQFPQKILIFGARIKQKQSLPMKMILLAELQRKIHQPKNIKMENGFQLTKQKAYIYMMTMGMLSRLKAKAVKRGKRSGKPRQRRPSMMKKGR